MKWGLRVLIFTAILSYVQCQIEWFRTDRLSWYNRKKLLQMESNILDDITLRAGTVLGIRFIYEDSPHYEIGYMMGEVMERYRKMVDNMYFIHTHTLQLFHEVRYLFQQQHFYLEGYHLVCMLHEIPNKYKDSPEFETLLSVVETGDTDKFFMSFEEAKAEAHAQQTHEKALERAKRKRVKEMKKSSKMANLGGGAENQNRPPKFDVTTSNKRPPWWYYTYGWDPTYESWWGG